MVSLGIIKFKGSENKDLPGGDKLQKNEKIKQNRFTFFEKRDII